MNVLQSFTVSTMKVHKKWTIVTVIGVIISAAMLSGVTTFTASFLDLLQRNQLSDYGRWTASFADVPVSDAAVWSEASEGNDVMMQRAVGFAELEGSKNTSKPYLYITQYDDAAFSHFFVTPTTGRLPENDGEIVLSDEIAQDAGVMYAVGDTISLDTGDRVYPDGTHAAPDSSYTDEFYSYDDESGQSVNLGSESLSVKETKTYTIVGFISPSIFDNAWTANYYCFTGFPGKTASSGEKADLYIWNEKVPFNYYSMIRSQAAELGYPAENITFNNGYLRYCGVQEAGSRQDLMFILVAVIVAIIIAASVSLIYNAFSISVSERTRHLGLLASAGATRKQKRIHVLFEGLLVGLMGIPLGILFGILGISCTFMLIKPIFASVTGADTAQLHTVVSGWSIGITALLACATLYVSVLVPAVRASHIMPIDAIRQSKEIRLTPRSIRTRPLFRKLFGFEAELAIKNFRRNRRKYRATIVSLVISLVLFLTVSSYVQFGKIYTESSSNQINYDIYLQIDRISQAERMNIFDQIAKLPDTEMIATLRQQFLYLRSDRDIRTQIAKSLPYESSSITVNLCAYDDAGFEAYAASVGADPNDYTDPERPSGILINHAMEYDYTNEKKLIGDVLDIAEGSTLTAGYYTGDTYASAQETDDSSYIVTMDFVVKKIASELPAGMTTGGFSGVNLIMPESLYEAVMLKAGIPLPDSDADYPPAYIVARDSRALEDGIKEILKTVPGSQTSLFNISSMREQDQKTTFILGVFVYGFITLISMICIANIFNTITTNVALRQKEFAMLRSVGMTPASFTRMIRFESIFYGCKALLLGLPISILISYYLYRSQMFVYSFEFTLPWHSYIVAILLVFLLVFSTMLYSVSRVNKTNIVDTLKMDMM